MWALLVSRAAGRRGPPAHGPGTRLIPLSPQILCPRKILRILSCRAAGGALSGGVVLGLYRVPQQYDERKHAQRRPERHVQAADARHDEAEHVPPAALDPP